MKISELQKNLEYYKKEKDDLEIRLVIDSHNCEEYNELINAYIDTTQVCKIISIKNNINTLLWKIKKESF